MSKLIKNDQDFWHFVSSLVFIFLVVILIYHLSAANEIKYSIPFYDFLILIMATFRLVRLLTYDSVTDYIRKYLDQYSSGWRRNLRDLIHCPWCTGVWMSLFVAFLYFDVPISWIFLLVMALAGAGTFIQILIWKIGLEDSNLRISYEKKVEYDNKEN